MTQRGYGEYLMERPEVTHTKNSRGQKIKGLPSSGEAVINSIIVSNDSGSGDTLTLTITNTSSAVFNLFQVKAVAANTSIELLTRDLILSGTAAGITATEMATNFHERNGAKLIQINETTQNFEYKVM